MNGSEAMRSFELPLVAFVAYDVRLIAAAATEGLTAS